MTVRSESRAAVLLGLCLATLSACSTVSVYADPMAHDRSQDLPVNLFDVEWTADLVKPPLFEYAPREVAAVSRDPQSGRLVVLTRDGVIHALSAEGLLVWSFDTKMPFNADALVEDGVAYVPGSNGVLYAFDVRTEEETGKALWTYNAGEELATTPTLSNGKLFFSSQSDTLYAVEAKTGKWLWQYRRDPPSGFTVRGASRPKESAGLIWAGFSDGALVGLDPTDGTPKFEKALSGSGTQFLDVDTSPAFDAAGTTLFAASYQDGLFALDAKSGETKWHTVTPGITSLALHGQTLFATGDRKVSAYNTRTGKLLWSLNVGDRFSQPALLARGFLMVPTNNALIFIDPATGRSRLSWNPGRGISATPFYDSGKLYVLSNLGYVYALNLHGNR